MGRPETGIGRYQPFVDEFLALGGGVGAGTEAYMKTHLRCSRKIAAQKACELLSNPIVRKLLNEAKLAQQERTQITADKILHELLLIARADVSKAFDKKGRMLPIHEIPEDVRRAISGVETLETFIGGKGGRVHTSKLKFWDKVAALGLLGKNLRLFVDKVELSGTIKTVRINSNINPDGTGD